MVFCDLWVAVVVWRPFLRARCWIEWNQTYLLNISVKLVHTQLKACSLSLRFFFSLFDKTLPEHYYLGPLDLFFSSLQ